MHHQGVAQAILLLVQQYLVTGAEADVVHLDAGVRLHDRRAQKPLHVDQFVAAAQGAQGAFALLLHGVPDRDGVNVVTHKDLHFIGVQKETCIIIPCKAAYN